MKIFLPGGAGLVGLNLIALLQEKHPDWELLVVDKKSDAVLIARDLFPNVTFLVEDLCEIAHQQWPEAIQGCQSCVMLQAEIGNTDSTSFERNNVLSTEVILKQLRKAGISRLVHVSSSVVKSQANDLYTKTKRKQEELVLTHFPNAVVLRPTLMFGWFDRKHLGWLARFMKKLPVFPIPGSGRFIRQPLFVGDFCALIQRCLEEHSFSGIYDITGLEKISYIKLMCDLRRALGARTLIIHLPIPLFAFLLRCWALISQNPAFTYSQLKALTAGDQFEIIDWPRIFSVPATPLFLALQITYMDPHYSQIEMPF